MEHLDHPSPLFPWRQYGAFFLLRAFFIAFGGNGVRLIVPFYSVQDCNLGQNKWTIWATPPPSFQWRQNGAFAPSREAIAPFVPEDYLGSGCYHLCCQLMLQRWRILRCIQTICFLTNVSWDQSANTQCKIHSHIFSLTSDLVKKHQTCLCRTFHTMNRRTECDKRAFMYI